MFTFKTTIDTSTLWAANLKVEHSETPVEFSAGVVVGDQHGGTAHAVAADSRSKRTAAYVVQTGNRATPTNIVNGGEYGCRGVSEADITQAETATCYRLGLHRWFESGTPTVRKQITGEQSHGPAHVVADSRLSRFSFGTERHNLTGRPATNWLLAVGCLFDSGRSRSSVRTFLSRGVMDGVSDERNISRT